MVKYYLIAGERSGDLHGSNLIASLKKYDQQALFRGVGGEQMQQNGLSLYLHYKNMAFMGFLEVLLNLRKISGYLKQTKADIVYYQPDVVILIDYGGFNLKMASFLKSKGIKVYYYISPKIWAWNQGRANKIKRIVDRMFVIMPFEKEFYKRFNWEVDYVGNPVLDAVKKHEPQKIQLQNNNKSVIAVLPGSRFQEVTKVMEVITKVVKSNSNLHFAIAAVDNLDISTYGDLRNLPNAELIYGQTYDLLQQSDAAIVTSGTATLETALLKIPQVVIYKTSAISYYIGRALIQVGYISLVNLITNKPVVKELIQHDFNEDMLNQELNKILFNEDYRASMIKDYNQLYQTLDIGSASDNTANLIVQYLTAE